MKTLLITTGGTLACRETSEGLSPILKGKDILSYADDKSDISVLDFRLIDSSIMTDDDRNDLATLIFNKQDEFDSFIITHGTDSLAYTASFLDCALENFNKTVVLTAAQLPLVYKNTDAIDNLNLAIKTAKSGYYGVCVSISNKIMPAKTLTKIDTQGFSCFTTVDNTYLTQPVERTLKSAKLLKMNDKKIDVVFITPILSADEILKKDIFSDIIVLSLGSGGMLLNQLDAFKKLSKKGIRIHLKSQCLLGDIETVYSAHTGTREFNIPKKSSLEYLIYSIKFSMC